MLEMGAGAGALASLEHGRKLAGKRGNRLALIDMLMSLARARIQRAEWRAAEQSLDEALALARAMAYPYGEARALAVYGELRAAQDARPRAGVLFDQARAICERLGERLYRQRVERFVATL
jgi:hypothetical protein